VIPDVAALYIDPRGPYPKLAGVECWDEKRDARNYAGPWPVVAHPPCGPWSAMRHLAFKTEAIVSCAPRAVEQVRRWGGVLEHPARSTLWRAAGLPLPGELPDVFGGITIEVRQCDWGHVAEKLTWLYLVGGKPTGYRWPARREPTHWISGHRYRKSTSGGVMPLNIKQCSAEQRRRTPPAFAEFLVALARSCRRAAAA
jgi:hypothetical protein